MDKARYDLALDMDETLCSFVGCIMQKMQSVQPDLRIKLPTFGRYNKWFDDYWPDDRSPLQEHIFTDEFYLSLTPMLDGFEGRTLEKLSIACWERFDRIIVPTYRHGFMPNPKEVTQEWLKLNGFVDSERVQVHVLKGSESKLSYLKRSTVVVDDSLTVANDVTSSHNHHMVLINHPWNDGYARKVNCTVTPVRRLIENICTARESL